MKWYMLPISEQRVYHQLLLHAQQPKVIFIADVKPLNMATYLAVSESRIQFKTPCEWSLFLSRSLK